jgi:HAD superfamily hydrolase (TIGR01549 family)
MTSIPFEEIDTLFFDVGGTLVSINYEWVCDELARLGVKCEIEQLQRAEAAARPIISEAMATEPPGETEKPDGFMLFLDVILRQLGRIMGDHLNAMRLARELSPILRPPGKSYLLWSSLLPRVHEALEGLRGMGYKMAAVSNADGTVERGLSELGIRPFFDMVVDSYIIGVAKPDPGIFHYALHGLKADPGKTLHIGDMYFADIIGARQAGIYALLLDPFNDWKDVDCDRFPDIFAVYETLSSQA